MLKRRNWDANEERIQKKTKTETMEIPNAKTILSQFDLSEYHEALQKFSETSKQQIVSLMVEGGLDAQTAISTLLEKLRSEHGNKEEDIQRTEKYTDEEILLVMKIAGFSKKDAIRALLVRDELVKLRKKGMQGVEAVDELAARMKALSGVKRKHCSSSSSLECSNESQCNCNSISKETEDLVSLVSSNHSISIPFKKIRSNEPSVDNCTNSSSSSSIIENTESISNLSNSNNPLLPKIIELPSISNFANTSSTNTNDSLIFQNSNKRTGHDLFEEDFFLEDLDVVHSSKKFKQTNVHQTDDTTSIDSN